MNTLVHGTLLEVDVIWVLECKVEKFPSGRKVMVLHDVLGPVGCVILHTQTLFVQSDVKRLLLSVGKLTESGAEFKFGSKDSWIDLLTDTGIQRVIVRVKGKTFGLDSEKPMLELSLRQMTQLHMQKWRREMKRSAEQKHRPASSSIGSCGGTETRRGSRNAARARSPWPCTWQSSCQLGQPLGEGILSSGRTLKTCETGWRRSGYRCGARRLRCGLDSSTQRQDESCRNVMRHGLQTVPERDRRSRRTRWAPCATSSKGTIGRWASTSWSHTPTVSTVVCIVRHGERSCKIAPAATSGEC